MRSKWSWGIQIFAPGTWGLSAPCQRAFSDRRSALPAVSIFGTDYPTPDGTGIRDYIHIEDLASAHLKTEVENLDIENGVIVDRRNEKSRVSYAELAKGKRIERHIGGVGLKKPAEFKIMGRAVLRRDAEEKVTGKAKYAGDIRLPEMLYARILRPPAHGANLIDVDLSGAKEVKDVDDSQLLLIQEKVINIIFLDNWLDKTI